MNIAGTLFPIDYKLCHVVLFRHLHHFKFRKFSLSVLVLTHYQKIVRNYGIVPIKSIIRKMSDRVDITSDSSVPFHGKGDRYEGITIASDKEQCNLDVFPDKLKNSLELWKNTKKRAVWFKVYLDQSDWVPILVKNGFKYHHAKKDYVMLYVWLSSSEIDNVPPYAHTMIGVGAVVVNESDQVLVVKEKYFYKEPLWKLPGGYVEPGENLVDASIREVLEETGIQTEFVSVLTVRHGHGGMFGCSDIYIVLNLKALTNNISKCDREIADCQWMDIEKYLSHPQIHELNRFFVSKLQHHKKHDLKIDCHYGVHQVLNKPFTVYSAFKGDDQEEYQKIPFSSISGSSKD
ncbi:uncharacterized protein [Euwallacea fornicatus]|uniref:uncharacterized protein isoform X1 n=2 Tax=Euwallacea fornicatus TaxID=995702 RepID=UPI00338FCB9F